jgi:hypothetical protein
MDSSDDVGAAMMAAAGPQLPQQTTDVDPVSASMLAAAKGQGMTASTEAAHDKGHFSPVQAAASLVSGTAASVVGGFRGLYDLATFQGIDKAAQDVQDTQNRFTFRPNEATSEALASGKNPLNWVPNAAKWAGNKTLDATGSPALATAVETGINAAPSIAGMGLARARPVVSAEAAGTVDQALTAANVKPTEIPPDLLADMQEKATTGDLQPHEIAAQAEAAALPVPIKLLKGQASGDAAQFTQERELSKINGAGEPIRDRLTEQNQQLIDNLDAMGAKNAPSAADAGQAALTQMARIDQQMDAAKNAAYGAVRDSQGRAAMMDGESFYMKAQSALERDNSTQFLPPKIASIYEDLSEGKTPFTVDTMTNFDKILSREQRTNTNGNETHAVGLVRSALADTPVENASGDAAIAAYQKAKSLARAQFQLADPKSQNYIPSYAAMLKGMGDADHNGFIAALQNGTANIDPGKWFSQNVVKGDAGGVKKLGQFLNDNGGQSIMPQMQSGMMGAIRDQVVKGTDASGRTTFSGDALNKVLDKNGSLPVVLSPDQMTGLQRLANTATRIQRPPSQAAINWANTSSANANLQAVKDAGTVATKVLASRIPGGKAALFVNDVASGIGAKRAQRKFAQDALTPDYASPSETTRIKGAPFVKGVPLSLLLAKPVENGP